MSGISDALKSSANHLLGLERSLGIIQSNVGNASTQGYARQDVGAALDSSSADSFLQLSSRDEFAEQAVRLVAAMTNLPAEAGALAHKLKGSARGIGAFAVADAAGTKVTVSVRVGEAMGVLPEKAPSAD